MLVLSRKVGEQIRIGDDVVVTVQRISGNRVSIGIEAPRECRIVRGELLAMVEQLARKNSSETSPASSEAVASVLCEVVDPSAAQTSAVHSGNRIAELWHRSLRLPR